MAFQFEKEMIPYIKTALLELLGHGGHVVVRSEFNVDTRVVDLAVASFQSMWDENDLLSGDLARALRRLSLPQLDVLSRFYRVKSLSIHALSHQLMMDSQTVKENYLIPLMDLGLIKQISKYSYQANGWEACLPTELIIVEAKRQAWTDVIGQAITTRGFSTSSFVAIDGDRWTKCTWRIAQAREYDIGVMLVHDNGDTELLYTPLKRDMSFNCVLQCLRIIKHMASGSAQRSRGNLCEVL